MSFAVVIEFFLEYLNQTNNRLNQNHLKIKCDYERSMRNAWRLMLEIYDYTYTIDGELFHIIKSQWKRIGKYHLRGLYNYKINDSTFDNQFRKTIQKIFCLTLLPPSCVQRIFDLLIEQLYSSLDCFNLLDSDNETESDDSDTTKSSKSECNLMGDYFYYQECIDCFVHYCKKIWFGKKSRYNINEITNYDNAIRTSNLQETFHNLMRRYCTIHGSIHTFIHGLQTLEAMEVRRFLSYNIHGPQSKRRREYLDKERDIQNIFAKMKRKIQTKNNKVSNVKEKYWMKTLDKLQIVCYENTYKTQSQALENC